MSVILQIILVIALAAVSTVLVMGLWNLAKGGSANRSQSLMRMRVLLQFIAIVVAMGALYFTSK